MKLFIFLSLLFFLPGKGFADDFSLYLYHCELIENHCSERQCYSSFKLQKSPGSKPVLLGFVGDLELDLKIEQGVTFGSGLIWRSGQVKLHFFQPAEESPFFSRLELEETTFSLRCEPAELTEGAVTVSN